MVLLLYSLPRYSSEESCIKRKNRMPGPEKHEQSFRMKKKQQNTGPSYIKMNAKVFVHPNVVGGIVYYNLQGIQHCKTLWTRCLERRVRGDGVNVSLGGLVTPHF